MRASLVLFIRLLPLICLLLCFSCKSDPKSAANSADNDEPQGPTLFELLDPTQTGVNFMNALNESLKVNYLNFNYLYIGGAVGVGDFNQDGLPDLYLTSILGENKLYFNKGDFHFEDVTAKAGTVNVPIGIKTGVSIVDINNDGWPDIYQCRTASLPAERGNLLFVNNHDGTFTESAAAYGLNTDCASTQACFFDYDLDGDLDMYLLNHMVDFSKPFSLFVKKVGDEYVRILEPENEYDSDRLYRNDKGKFVNVSKQAGIINHKFGLSVTVSDFNRDGYPDVYIASDYAEPDNLFINNRNGTFTDRLNDYMPHTSYFSMGTDMQDINNDGLMDLVELDMDAEGSERQKILSSAMTAERYQMLVNYKYGYEMMRNMLQINNGNGTFSDIGRLAGVSSTDWSWAPLIFDFDNDGYRDIYITNGHRREVTNLDYAVYTMDSVMKINGGKISEIEKYIDIIPTTPLRHYMYRNRGDLTFENVSVNWGFKDRVLSNGAVQVDLDNDGDLDLVVSNATVPASIYRNKAIETKSGNYFQVNLEGPPENPAGFGATVLLHVNNQLLIAEEQPVRGFLSTSSKILHFGVGKADKIDKVDVQWPGGKVQTMEQVPVNQRITLKYEDAKAGPSIFKNIATTPPLFADITKESGIKYVHHENPYYDFNRERLIPHKYSNIGPPLASGDMNGDGLEDFYIGASFHQAGALYLQQKNGQFKEVLSPFAADTAYEDTGALFFDADGDKDLDLYLVSGGNELPMNSKVYQDRLYLNDGTGNLQYAPDRLPTEAWSGSCVAANDYDRDGDLDIFVGGSIIPGQFPKPPNSLVLQNNGGKFTDVTQQVAPEFSQLGLITAITFADLDQDKQDEMLVSGEWMAVEVFKNQGNKFSRATTNFGLDKDKGWWECVTAADMDGDGDMDLLVGNLGMNTRFHASPEAPLRVYAKDFDKNGSIDPLMSWVENGVEYPVPFRDPLLKQIPSLKKKFVRYTPYAKSTMEGVYPRSELATAQILEATELKTCYFENVNGKFTMRALPNEAQFAPTRCILTADVDGNGTMDVLLTGNDYGPEVETGRYDAGIGTVLLGDGKGHFTTLANRNSGFWTRGDSRQMRWLKMANGKNAVLVSNNDGPPQLIVQK